MFKKKPLEINILEYRFNDEANHFPALCYVKDITPMEVICRRNCEQFLYNGRRFENLSSALESKKHVLYLKEIQGLFYPNISFSKEGLGIEVRLYKEKGVQEPIDFIPCENHLELMLYLDVSFQYADNVQEYLRVCAEFDQDRKTYVLYVEPTDSKLS